jgi:hypothetical protein
VRLTADDDEIGIVGTHILDPEVTQQGQVKTTDEIAPGDLGEVEGATARRIRA